MSRRIAALALLGLATAAPAQAAGTDTATPAGAKAPAVPAVVSLAVARGPDVRLGTRTRLSGRVTAGGAPLARRTVVLQVRRHPFRGRWRARATRRTDARGRFAFAPRLDRNHDVRARLVPLGPDAAYAPGRAEALSRVRRAFVLPAFTLSFAQRGGRRIRITQTYSVPRDVRLSAPTRFYVGRRAARRARMRATARTRRVRAGRYLARATVTIPASYGGRFAYVSCFAYSKGSGMGDPDLRCPRRAVRLRR